MVTLISSLASGQWSSKLAAKTPLAPATAPDVAAPKTSVNKDEASGRFVMTTQSQGELQQWPLPRDILFSRGIADYFRSLQLEEQQPK